MYDMLRAQWAEAARAAHVGEAFEWRPMTIQATGTALWMIGPTLGVGASAIAQCAASTAIDSDASPIGLSNWLWTQTEGIDTTLSLRCVEDPSPPTPPTDFLGGDGAAEALRQESGTSMDPAKVACIIVLAVGGAATLLSACLLYSRRRAAQKRPKGHAAGYQMTDIAAMSSTAT